MSVSRQSAAIIDEEEAVLSPWVTVAAKRVRLPGSESPQVYHALRQHDYVTVLALDPQGRIPLVRQFRPAVGRETLELPGGLHDGGGTPAETASGELEEEAGLRPIVPLIPLGCFDPDSGRLENQFWGFFAAQTEMITGWQPEPGVSREAMTPDELISAIEAGRFTMALHIALIGLARMRGLI